MLYHADNVEASGFVEHLKLPHYVDFQGELELIRKIRREQEERRAGAELPGGRRMTHDPALQLRLSRRVRPSA